ncbi:TonB-dependent outer membrane receptor, SusC/RagA subfamily, signature region [Aquimarina amphilecti]|uniref:TonB-dependent outer membrane receptor, SusC/RagA subfamily, signature region n=1 Tax=Aquimarina amphilecti TaxID=1038014 RepID=A0A1H7M1L8_AQUAM|nr:VIT domain-containing protein [Aquimarina amphilecti]SEL05051.1 TonB-dependent outer membrane receptor, SusC/RagA subfamily, signature region [Aquimarina amphilecti]
MKKLLILFTFFISLSTLLSQETPFIQLKDSTQLKLSVLKVDVKIVGNFATTTYDMKFYNELNRTLEGELIFPLGQGQSVSGFAMDVNDKMREAVIVEKELARVAYESTVRQNIDPGLLEKTQGNNYKARIYPILPRDYKNVVITYEQELFGKNNSKLYELPLNFTNNFDEFLIDITVYGDRKPLINNDDLIFHQEGNTYKALAHKKDYLASSSIIIDIPKSLGSRQVITHNDFFYINQQLAPNSRLKEKPDSITILWDSSFSNNHRKVKKELELLDRYFSYLQNIKVRFISFSNSMHSDKEFRVIDGNWSILKEQIEKITYDGGTYLGFLDSMKIKSDEILIFTDGLINLGHFNKKINRSIYTVNSSVSGDHEYMNRIATTSGGNYINLTRFSTENALEILKHETYQFLGISNNSMLEEVYPNQNTNVLSDFSLSGKFKENTTIKLLFGYRNKVTEEIEIYITSGTEDKTIRRLWAKQKLSFLNKNKKQNKNKIISLAKQYKLITEYTSMLILDRIEDYVKYRIEPPQELKEAYKERIENIEQEELYKREEIEERRTDLFNEYEDLWSWYTTEFPKKVEKTKQKINTRNINSNQNTQQRVSIDTLREPISDTTNVSIETSRNTIDITKRIVSGVITDDKGLPLPGVNVWVEETNHGTQTDIDGNFRINAEVTQELNISYIGFASKKSATTNSSNLQIKLEEDASLLEEVVVVGYGVQKRKSMTASVVTVTNQSFSGAVAGVQVGNSQPGTNSSIVVRGVSSITSNSEPLYIVNGVPVQGNPTNKLLPDEIESMQVLKEEAGEALYGSAGNNGIIVITTKEGKENNLEKIEQLNQKISEKIELKSWNPDTPYLKILKKEKTIDLAYAKYLEIRSQYTNTPSFYLDVADFFDRKEAPDIAIKILTNLIEKDLDNHELMRALAYKLEYFKQNELAVVVYEKILELRPEEPQSYRDLALAYENIGEFQKSFDLLYKIYNGDLLEKDEDERFLGIEQLAYVELSRLVHKYKKKLKLSESTKTIFKEIPVDVRVVIDWNHNDTDIDLWVIDPNEEKGYYSNTETEIGGRLSQDMTEGYGPEEFMLKKAIKGNYKVMIDYYADNVQKISGPTILKVTMFTNYGKKNESKKVSIVRLGKQEEEIEIGSLKF